MNLFEYAKIKNSSLIDTIKTYIKKKHIKKIYLHHDYEGKIVDLYKKDDFYKKFGYYQYSLLAYAKGFNYKVWVTFNSSNNLKDFLEKVEKVFGVKRREHFEMLITTHNISSLKEFGDEYIFEPIKISLIEADSIEEIEKIKKDIKLFKAQLSNQPDLIYKREIKKICGITERRKSDDEVGNGIESLFT